MADMGQMPEEPIDDMEDDADMENEFGTDFDPGVEADEAQDPKRFIQQLTGKLSQSLRSYNQTLPQPDADLGKYVAGMIIKQATEGLTPEDKNEILKKVETDNTEEIPNNQEDGGDVETEMDAEMQSNDNGGEQDFDGMESKTNQPDVDKIDEIVNSVMDNNGDEDIEKQVDNVSFKKKPFTSQY